MSDKTIHNYVKTMQLKLNLKKIKKKSYMFISFLNKLLKPKNKYERWLKKNYPTRTFLEQQHLVRFQQELLISICIPVYNTPASLLTKMLDSVLLQTYINWELCIFDAGQKVSTKKILEEYLKKDKRIKVKYLSENKGIAGNSNEAIAMAKGDYIGLLDHDDILMPTCLYEILKAINDSKFIVDVLYTDEAFISSNGKSVEFIHFKPGWSPHTLRTINYVCHFLVVKRSLLASIGGLRDGFDGSQDHDLILRLANKTNNILHIPKVLYLWTQHAKSKSHLDLSTCISSSISAIQEAIKQKGVNARVITIQENSTAYKITQVDNYEYKITIIIDARKGIHNIYECLKSIIAQGYQHIEIFIITFNKIQIKEAINLFESIKIIIIEIKPNDNFFVYYNKIIHQIDSHFCLFLCAYNKIISNIYIYEMLVLMDDKTVSIVGSEIINQINNISSKALFIRQEIIPINFFFYFYNNIGVSNVSAVNFNGMMVRTKLLKSINGFDVNFNSDLAGVDLCLNMTSKFYHILFTPFAQISLEQDLYMEINLLNEIVSQNFDFDILDKKWNIKNFQDPYYNPNLTLTKNDFSLKD